MRHSVAIDSRESQGKPESVRTGISGSRTQTGQINFGVIDGSSLLLSGFRLVTCNSVPTPKSKKIFLLHHHHYFLGKLLNSSCIMDVSKFGRSNNGNAAPNIEARYDTTKPILNLLSTSRNRMNMENERKNKPSDQPGVFDLQLSNFKLSKRLDINNPISEPGDHACPPLFTVNISFSKSR